MADVAHDTFGPASPKRDDIAPQQASPPRSPDKGKLRVFISYSRQDLDFADQLAAALDSSGFECFIDREGISGGEAWKRRLGNLISEADTVVFVLSPDSARSETCNWEVEEAARLNKRILPANWRPLEGVSPPPRLRDLNYIFFYKEPKVPGSGFGTGLANLVAALNTGFDWLREHTRYLQRTIEWDKGGRPANRLLSGNDILDAKAWVARRPKGAPEPTALQLDFIRASEQEADARLSEQRKQLEAVTAAQAERETALQEREEALKQFVAAQRGRRVRTIGLLVVSFCAALAGLVGWRVNQLRIMAEDQRQQADATVARSRSIMAALQEIEVDATHEDAVSMKNLVLNYIRDDPKAAQARELFEKAAAKDDAAAIANLGVLFEQGQGVAQDYAKAREFYQKAAELGDASALANIGLLYRDGLGVTQDYVKALGWFEKAAAKGNAAGMVNLGLLYQVGLGVPQDDTKAREWFEKAAAKGDAAGMVNLGLLYQVGRGVPQDYTKALERFEKAAAKGDVASKIA